ncbi:hypothetical protein AB833_10790 [Chromatiales bacterium (ex Bugula neritina AB1)]|nr:hypothetical protein AB833_10790 [Chromatiales bacterium (ex Bugula neritina AB1)]
MKNANYEFQSVISRHRQLGASQGWMLLTIGIMVGFIFGFVLFLSRLPEDHYTLVETERAVEQYKPSDASQFAFYDRLSEVDSAVPNIKADEMPAFSRTQSAGKYGANDNERPGAVQIAEGFNVDEGVQPIGGVSGTGGTVSGASAAALARQQQAKLREIQQPTVVKKIRNKPSTSYYLQAGAFTTSGDAQRLREQLQVSGMDAFVRTVAIEGKKWHRVRIGPFYDSDNLYNAQTRLGRSGISYLVIKVQS